MWGARVQRCRQQAMCGNVWNSRDSYQRWRQDPDMNHLLWWTAGVDHHLTRQTCICNQRLELGELIKPDLRGQEAAVRVKAGLFINSNVEHYIMSVVETVLHYICSNACWPESLTRQSCGASSKAWKCGQDDLQKVKLSVRVRNYDGLRHSAQFPFFQSIVFGYLFLISDAMIHFLHDLC